MPDPQPRINYPGNAKTTPPEKTQEERPEVKKVIKGDARTRKQPLHRRVSEELVQESGSSVGQYILFDVMLPAAKSMISDMVSQGVERMLFGDSRPRHGAGPRTNYSSYSRQPVGYSQTRRPEEPRTISARGRANHMFREVVLDDRGEAEIVLDNLRAKVEHYNVATVSDLYSMVGISPQYTDDRHGWFNLDAASVVRVREGYIIDLPRTMPIT